MTGVGAVAGQVRSSFATALSNAAAPNAASLNAPGSAAGMPFAGMMRAMVEQTTALDQKASQAVTGVMNGQGVEVHDAMIATQKADIAFELALQVRNKAVAAYQQMMNMQF